MKFWSITLLTLLGLGLSSCEEDVAQSSYPTIEQYLERNDITEYEITASGLVYIIIKEGTGQFPRPGETITVHYTGYHLDDTKFDSSYDRNEAFSFILGSQGIIEGWNEGMTKFNKGTVGTLLIPWELAYGEGGTTNGPIGPKEDLKFDINILAID